MLKADTAESETVSASSADEGGMEAKLSAGRALAALFTGLTQSIIY